MKTKKLSAKPEPRTPTTEQAHQAASMDPTQTQDAVQTSLNQPQAAAQDATGNAASMQQGEAQNNLNRPQPAGQSQTGNADSVSQPASMDLAQLQAEGQTKLRKTQPAGQYETGNAASMQQGEAQTSFNQPQAAAQDGTGNAASMQQYVAQTSLNQPQATAQDAIGNAASMQQGAALTSLIQPQASAQNGTGNADSVSQPASMDLAQLQAEGQTKLRKTQPAGQYETGNLGSLSQPISETLQAAPTEAKPASVSAPGGALPIFSEILSTKEEEAVLTPPRKQRQRQVFHFAWVPGVLLRPAKTIRAILADEKPNWLLPMLLLSLMLILNVVLSGPAQRNAIQSGLNMPPEFQYWTPEEQSNYLAAQASKSSPTFIYVYPILVGIGGWWVVWFLMANILHLMITLAGSRSPNVKSSNLVGWAMLPFALGLLIKAITVASAGRLLTPAPLAALLPADVSGFQLYLRSVLDKIDAYWIWHAVLLFVGAKPLSKLAGGKAVGAVLAAILIMLLLQGIPGLIGGLLGNMSTGGMFF